MSPFFDGEPQRAGCEAVFFPDPADFFHASRIRRSDFILLDMTPDGTTDPFQTLCEVVQSDSITPVICLSADSNVRRAVRAMKLGAFDYLPSSCTSLEFRTALDEAFEFHQRNRQQTAHRLDILSRYEQLTAREKQVFALTVSGLPNKEIAETLGLALQTVKIHRGRVMAKMATTSALELFQSAQILGHLPPSSKFSNSSRDQLLENIIT